MDFVMSLLGFLCRQKIQVILRINNSNDIYTKDIFTLPLKPSLLLLLILPTKISPINGRKTINRKCTRSIEFNMTA